MRILSNIFSRTTLFACCLLIGFTACQSDDEVDDEVTVAEVRAFPLAHEELWPHFQRFEEEAALRGYNFDLNALEITGFLEDIPRENVAGTCRYGTHINEVTIDRIFWRNSTLLRKELVVFHELGHCVLFQAHREEVDANGNCASLMNSGTGDCRVPYTVSTRDIYIDELFAQWE